MTDRRSTPARVTAILAALLFAGLAALLFPGVARAVVVTRAPTPPPGQTATFTYKTFLGPQALNGGPVGNLNEDFGTLTLTFNANKIISGTYKPDTGIWRPVTGGITGPNSFWLELGSGRLHFTGRFTRHGIAASATGFGLTEWRLHGSYTGG